MSREREDLEIYGVPAETIEPTKGLRFLGATLQQEFIVHHIECGVLTLRYEWRDVPVVQEGLTGATTA